MRTASNRFSNPKGTVTQNWEIIGFRPGFSDWAELLAITNDLEGFRRNKIQHVNRGTYDAFARVLVLHPGDVRPVDVVQVPETQTFWDCREDWYTEFCGQFDSGDCLHSGPFYVVYDDTEFRHSGAIGDFESRAEATDYLLEKFNRGECNGGSVVHGSVETSLLDFRMKFDDGRLIKLQPAAVEG